MNQFLRGVAQALAESFELPGPVLEIGAYRVAGQESISDLRPLFSNVPYTGMDARPGPGVDLVADVEELPYPDASIGTVLAFSTFEHVPCFWKGFQEVHRVLRSDGAFIVASPFYFHIHDYPSDYWRFTPAALEMLLADYPSTLIGWHGPTTRPANVWALAFREERPAITEAEHARYRELMNRYAREPLSWQRRLRYRLARLICGNRPVAPWLQREQWDSVCRHRALPVHRPTSAAPALARRRLVPR